MNKKLFIILILLLLFLCSCTNKNHTGITKEIVNVSESNLHQDQEVKLPEGFTIDKIKSALLEYNNYRLWLYPAEILDDVLDKNFDKYIDKSIAVEIRVYKTSSGESVYAHTSIGQWLVTFKIVNGFLYCDGQISDGEYGWPDNIKDYAVVEKYSIIIPPPHKPNYGTSQRKDTMIAALESSIKAACEDFYKGADKNHEEWTNVDVYIANFYEYENVAHAWLCRQDSSITNFPVVFEEVNNEFKVQNIKGFTLNNKSELNEFGRFQYDRDISDSVKNFKCYLK